MVKLEQVHIVESYKEYNIVDKKKHDVKDLGKKAKKNTNCDCTIFWNKDYITIIQSCLFNKYNIAELSILVRDSLLRIDLYRDCFRINQRILRLWIRKQQPSIY